MTTFKLKINASWLKTVAPEARTEYELAYYPLHAMGADGDQYTLKGSTVTVKTDLPKEDWIERQDRFAYEPDGSGFRQRYTVL